MAPLRVPSVTVAERHPVVDFATHQTVRGLVIHFDVVERVGQDLDCPNHSGLQVPDEEQLDGPQNHPGGSDKQPAHSELMEKLPSAFPWADHAEERRMEV